jgi:uncharacterized protein (TIGR00255 family)
MIASMTGFARAAGADAGRAWTWELRSVNGRSLDVRCRLPQGHEYLEVASRQAIAGKLSRGNVSATMSVSLVGGQARLRINRVALDQVLAIVKELRESIDAAPPRLDGLLGVRGVVESTDDAPEDEATRTARDTAILATLGQAIAALAKARGDEGRELARSLSSHLDEIEELTREAAANPATSASAIKQRLEAQVQELLGQTPALSAERMAQEAAMLAVRADIREELDRLAAHVKATRALLAGGGAIGRKLDFLAQELNREANTLCSKSNDLALTRTGLGLKAAIDRLREQAANVE